MPHTSSSDAASIGAHGPLPSPPSVAFGNNPKLEFDENDDAFGEADSGSPNGLMDTAPEISLKRESDSGPSASAGTKRKRPLKLTPSQRERKRAIDREAQRSIRIKTKNYIAHLENLVKVMEQSDTLGSDGGNNRTQELMSQLRQSQDEVRRLREAMLGVQRMLGTVLTDSSTQNQILDGMLHRQSSNSTSPPSVTEPHPSASFTAPPPGPSLSQTTSMPQRSPPHRHPSTVSLPTVPSQPNNQTTTLQEVAERPKPGRWRRYEGELFYFAEYQLNRVLAAGPQAFGILTFDEDIAVRAVIEGWAAVENEYSLDLAWQVIREIDQVIWADVGVVERMAVIGFMRTRLLHQVNSRAGVGPLPTIPSFATQEVVKHARHADIIDHFIWPGFRNVLSELPEKYITNHFTDKFRFNLKFLWPFDLGSAYTKDPLTQMYSSTPEFAGRQWDIRCWTMKRRFFDGSEELVGAIPSFEVPIQRSLSLPGPPPRMGMKRPSSGRGGINHHAHSMGMVEEAEIAGDEGDAMPVDQSTRMHDTNRLSMNGNADPLPVGPGDMGLGGGWHSVSPSQSIPPYWEMSAIGVSGSGIDPAYNGLGNHAGTGYPI